MDLWVTFEIREHGELGECDLHVHVHSRHCPHACEGMFYTTGPSLFLNIPFSLGFHGLKPCMSLSPQRRHLSLLCPDSKCWRGPFPFSIYISPWMSSSIPMVSTAINKLAPRSFSLAQIPPLSSRLTYPTVYLTPPFVHLTGIANLKHLRPNSVPSLSPNKKPRPFFFD